MKNSKSIIITLSVLCLFGLISAFNSSKIDKSSMAEITMPMWEMSKHHTLEVAAAMPEDKFMYKPSEASKTFGQQLVHIGYSLSYFSMTMMKDESLNYNEPDASKLSKKEIIAIVEKGFDDITHSVKQLTPEELEVEIPFRKGKKISRAQAIIFAHNHATNHRAKANLYIRMNDIEPPSYKFM